MGMFIRSGSTFINLTAVRSVGFDLYGGDRCVVLRYDDGMVRFGLDSPEAAQICECVVPHLFHDEIEAEFFGDDDAEPGPVAKPGGGGGPRSGGRNRRMAMV